MTDANYRLTLAQPATYEIKVPGELGESWSDWTGNMTIKVEQREDSPPITILSGTIDQAALHSLLRRLYGMGLPLISVICVECG